MTNFNNQLIRNLENAPVYDTDGKPKTAKPFTDDEVKARKLPKRDRDGNDPNLIVIPFITDTHYASNNVEDYKGSKAEDKLSIDHMQDFVNFMTKYKVDALVHGGDIIDGKSTRSDAVKDLREALTLLRGAAFAGGSKVPALIAKGNHDDNILATTIPKDRTDGRPLPYDKFDFKGVIQGSVLDPIFRANSGGQIVFGVDKIKNQPFSDAYEAYMDYDEFIAVKRTTAVSDLRILDKDIKPLKSMMATLTSSDLGGENTQWINSTAKTAFETLLTRAKGATGSNPVHVVDVIPNSTTRQQVINMIQLSAKARLRGTYAHLDVKDVRLILLDAYDIPYTTLAGDKVEFAMKDYGGYSAAQAQWFADTLKEAETLGYPVMIFGHHALAGAGFTRDGGPKVLKNDPKGDDYWLANNELMKAILDDFVKGQSNTISTLDAIKIYSGEPSPGLAVRAKLFLDNAEKVTALSAYNNVTVAGLSYPSSRNAAVSRKKAISTADYMSAVVTTRFTKENTVIGVVTGHSHTERTTVDPVTKKYVNLMSNSSLISGKLIGKGGWEVSKYNKETNNDSGTIPRVVGEYTQNAWEVIVIDKSNNQVSLFPVGAGMINRAKATGLYPTEAQVKTVKETPQNLTTEGKYPVRRFTYVTPEVPGTTKVLEKGLQE